MRIREMFRGGGGGGGGGGGRGGGGGGVGGGGHHGGGGYGGGYGGGWGWNWNWMLPSSILVPGGIVVAESALQPTVQPCTMDLECPSGQCSMWGTCV